jgi:nucleotide-binding universal stress UspA family protein
MAGTPHHGSESLFAAPLWVEQLRHVNAKARGLTRLLVATDFSMSADLALARALRLPWGEGATITLLHVARPVPGRAPSGDILLEGRCLNRVAGAVRRRLSLRAPGHMQVKEELRTGEPVEEVSQVARQLEVELVIAGRPYTARGQEPTVRGSTVRGLVCRLDAPLLVVGAHPARAYQRPMVAVDLSEDSRRALELALRVCPAPVGVDVLHVPEPSRVPGLWQEGMTAHEHWMAVRQDMETAARKALSRFLAPYREAGRECEVLIRCGAPLEEALLEEAVERGTDLLAVGMRAAAEEQPRSALAERLVMKASCDVLVARPHT